MLDIGTGKPDAEEAVAPHRLIDILDPSEAYSAADFRRDAINEMNAIVAEVGTRYLLVAQCLLQGIAGRFIATTSRGSRDLVSRLKGAIEQGWQALHDQLREIDPRIRAKEYTQMIHKAFKGIGSLSNFG
ncbi:tRNA dimethylallyltransferase [Vibrio lentus]|nr:tRNA dimethylallyltransferase [Vibrio lentus]